MSPEIPYSAGVQDGIFFAILIAGDLVSVVLIYFAISDWLEGRRARRRAREYYSKNFSSRTLLAPPD